MGRSSPTTWAQALLLGAPLLAVCAYLAWFALEQPETLAERPAVPIPGLPAPEADLAASRLEERVDGAAENLRRNGCKRLLAWRLSSPPADLEVYVFDRIEGAKAVLDRDAGDQRDPAPGDEASVTSQAILFRRGVFYAKLIADTSASGSSKSLRSVADDLDRGLSGAAGARLRDEMVRGNP